MEGDTVSESEDEDVGTFGTVICSSVWKACKMGRRATGRPSHEQRLAGTMLQGKLSSVRSLA